MDPKKPDPPSSSDEADAQAERAAAERDSAARAASEQSSEPAIPEAVVQPRRKLPAAVIWFVPLVAIGFALWALFSALQERGPTITIQFKSGEGIEARKTRIKYKNVDIGEVRSVRLSEDRQNVIVTAQLTRDADALVVEDTRFWVVRPRVSAGSVTGLSTLLAGTHIGVDAGLSNNKTRDFIGLEQPPLLTKDLSGRHFVLRAEDLHSLDIGSPIYFRHIQVGQVVGYNLDAEGTGVTIGIFINSPYERYVNQNSRFWFAEGVDVTLDANGLRINTQSVLSILIGGLAFETLPDMPANRPSPENAAFSVFPDRAKAMKATYSGYETYLLEFRESVRGLTVGAPVDFRGVVVGEVMSIDVKFDPAKKEITVPVRIRMYTERLRGMPGPYVYRNDQPADQKPFLDTLIQRGFRAQLRTANLLTSQLYVALDFFPGAKKVNVDWAAFPPEIPTMPGSLQELQASLASIASKLDKIPFDQIASQLTTTLQSAHRLMAKLDDESLPALRATLERPGRRSRARAE